MVCLFVCTIYFKDGLTSYTKCLNEVRKGSAKLALVSIIHLTQTNSCNFIPVCTFAFKLDLAKSAISVSPGLTRHISAEKTADSGIVVA